MKASFQDHSITSFKIKSTWKMKGKQKSCDSGTQTKEVNEFCDNSTQSGIRTEIIQSIVGDGNKSSVLDIVTNLSSRKFPQQYLNEAILDGYLLLDETSVVTDPSFVCDPKTYLELTLAKRDAAVSLQ